MALSPTQPGSAPSRLAPEFNHHHILLYIGSARYVQGDNSELSRKKEEAVLTP